MWPWEDLEYELLTFFQEFGSVQKSESNASTITSSQQFTIKNVSYTSRLPHSHALNNRLIVCVNSSGVEQNDNISFEAKRCPSKSKISTRSTRAPRSLLTYLGLLPASTRTMPFLINDLLIFLRAKPAD